MIFVIRYYISCHVIDKALRDFSKVFKYAELYVNDSLNFDGYCF